MDQASGLRQLIQQHAEEKWADKQANKQANKHDMVNYPRAISVTSGKGGVGKTNIVGNLAIAFSMLGKRVLIFDADLGLANIDVLFGIKAPYSINHVVQGEKKLSEVIVDGPKNIRIIPGGSGLQDLSNLSQGQRFNLLDEFDALNQEVDIFLIDTGAGISTNITYFNMAAEERIVISTPEPTSVTDAYALMKVMSIKHKTNDFKLLVNMADNKKEADGIYLNLKNSIMKFLKDIRLDYLGFIPKDEYLQKSVRQQSPVLLSYPKSISGKCFSKLASDLLENKNNQTTEGTLSYFWKKFIANTSL